ncbi:MAG: hypothetical protein M1365_13270, partial [Actinobacteria bacterium]|nr:hypothetical protein [Actinomycetota bacterium]
MGKRKKISLLNPLRLRRKVNWSTKAIIAYVLILFGSLIMIYAGISAITLKDSEYLSPLSSIILKKTPKNFLERELNKKDISYKKIKETESTIIIQIKDNGKVYFSTKKDLNMQISSLQLILSKLTIEGKRFKS